MVTDLAFTDDALHLVELLLVQSFVNMLDETIQSVHACGENVEFTKRFTFLGSSV